MLSPASLRERSVAAATAFFISGARPSSAHQHIERGGGGAARRGDILAQRRRIERRAVQQFAGAGDGLAREFFGKRRRQAGGDAGLRQSFGEQEDIGRPRPGHRRDRVHQGFVGRSIDRAGRR